MAAGLLSVPEQDDPAAIQPVHAEQDPMILINI